MTEHIAIRVKRIKINYKSHLSDRYRALMDYIITLSVRSRSLII
jgi:hypothetical protein